VRPKVKQRRELWQRVVSGVAQATIVVIDPEPVEAQVPELMRREEPIADKRIAVN